MELAPGLSGLPLDVSTGDREMRLNPVAVETPRGLLLLDVGLPERADVLADALAASRTLCFYGRYVDAGSDRLDELLAER
ncbi:hypothetical protein ABNG02_09675 [Halorubrum ejinorense]